MKEEHEVQIYSSVKAFFCTLTGLLIVTTLMEIELMAQPDLLSDYVNTGIGLVFLWACYQVGFGILDTLYNLFNPKEGQTQ